MLRTGVTWRSFGQEIGRRCRLDLGIDPHHPEPFAAGIRRDANRAGHLQIRMRRNIAALAFARRIASHDKGRRSGCRARSRNSAACRDADSDPPTHAPRRRYRARGRSPCRTDGCPRSVPGSNPSESATAYQPAPKLIGRHSAPMPRASGDRLRSRCGDDVEDQAIDRAKAAGHFKGVNEIRLAGNRNFDPVRGRRRRCWRVSARRRARCCTNSVKLAGSKRPTKTNVVALCVHALRRLACDEQFLRTSAAQTSGRLHANRNGRYAETSLDRRRTPVSHRLVASPAAATHSTVVPCTQVRWQRTLLRTLVRSCGRSVRSIARLA